MKKKLLIMSGSLMLIALLFASVMIRNRNFNSRVHELELDRNLLRGGEVADDFISVKLLPRGYEARENASWYHSYHLEGEDPESEPHHAVGTIYELTITNLTKDIVNEWSACIYFPQDMMFNSGWNGDFELHQYVDENQQVYTFKDSKFVTENLSLEYIYDQSVLLIPMHQGDYFMYGPSSTSHEYPIKPSKTDGDEYSSKTIGYIVYAEDAYIEDIIWFTQGTITYKMQRSIFREPAFYVTCVLLWIWVMALVIMLIVSKKLKKVEKEKQIMENMVHKFELDDLTGIYSRQAFFHYAGNLLENEDKEYELAIIDIENYKLINSQRGDSIYDEYLVYIANYLKGICTNGFVGRFSRSKFVMINEIKDGNKLNPESILDEDMIKKSPMPNQVLKVGIYSPVDKTVSIRRCCDRVLLALVKINGIYGQNVSYYNDKLESQLIDDHKIEEYMEEALEKEQFKVYYQPKNDTATKKICGAEALVRWIHPEYGLMPPGRFIPIFEKNNFITKMDAYVFERVCMDIKECISRGINMVPVSINMSIKDFLEEGWIEDRCRFVEENEIDTRYIHLEVTESLYAEDPSMINEKVEWLRSKGYMIEMDDFGSGYSSLGMLATLSMDALKLDISFMRNLSETKVVVESIIYLAHKLNLTTVAEGVETEEQYNVVKEYGCDCIQGFYLGKPMSKDDFIELLCLQDK